MEAWAVKPDRNGIYWIESNAGNGIVSLRSAPLNIGPLVQEHILFRNDTVVLTSATMRTAGSFDYVRDRLQCYDADSTFVGSPFDYRESTLLYLPTDLPEPNASGYQNAVEQALINLAKAVGGRTLALFTSYAQLRRTVQSVAPALTEAGITVLSQSSGVSRHQLLELFKTNQRTILLGTRSFWEGVDVIGPALSALVLVRLPFAVPLRSHRRGAQRDLRRSVLPVPGARCHPALPPGFRPTHPQQDRSRPRRRARQAYPEQELRPALPRLTARVHRTPRPADQPAPSAAADWIERSASRPHSRVTEHAYARGFTACILTPLPRSR